MTAKEAYLKYKHMDMALSDEALMLASDPPSENRFITSVCYDLWSAVKDAVKEQPAVHQYHGVNCGKRIHGTSTDYLHGPYDDSPYDVDGCQYCGRCHIAL